MLFGRGKVEIGSDLGLRKRANDCGKGNKGSGVNLD